MDLKTLKGRLNELEPIYVSTGRPAVLRILEKSARCACDVFLDNSAGEEERIATELHSLLSSSLNSETQPTVRLAIHLPLESVIPTDAGRALIILSDLLGASAAVRIILHVRSWNFDWPALRGLIEFLRNHLTRSNDVPIRLVAPFREFNEELPTMFNLGVRIRFAAGWLPDSPPGDIPAIDLEVLRKFTEFGFRTIIEWYAHEGNL